MFAEFCVTPTPARQGGEGFLAGLGKFSAGKVGKSVWVLTVVESIILLQSWNGLDPLPLGESFSSVRGVLLTFASVLGSHLCHKSGALYWHVVSMFRRVID